MNEVNRQYINGFYMNVFFMINVGDVFCCSFFVRYVIIRQYINGFYNGR